MRISAVHCRWNQLINLAVLCHDAPPLTRFSASMPSESATVGAAPHRVHRSDTTQDGDNPNHQSLQGHGQSPDRVPGPPRDARGSDRTVLAAHLSPMSKTA